MKSFRKQLKTLSRLIAAILSISFLLFLCVEKAISTKNELAITRELVIKNYQILASKEANVISRIVENYKSQMHQAITNKIKKDLEELGKLADSLKYVDKHIFSKSIDTMVRSFQGYTDKLVVFENDPIINNLPLQLIKESKNAGKSIYTYSNSQGHKNIQIALYYKSHGIFVILNLDTNSLLLQEKEKVINELSNLKLGDDKNGFVFIIDFDNKVLLGKEFINSKNPIQIKKQMLNNLIYYQPSDSTEPRLLYVTADQDWKWYIGISKSAQELDTYISQIKKKLYYKFALAVSLLMLLSATIYFIVIKLVDVFLNKIYQDYVDFSDNFKSSLRDNITINTSNLKFDEHLEMAENINDILLDRFDIRQQLLDNYKKTQIILSSINEPIMVIDDGGIISYANNSAKKFFNRKQIINVDIDDFFESYDTSIKSLISKAKFSDIEINYKNRILNLSIYPILDNFRNVSQAVIILKDITEQKRRIEEEEKSRRLDSLGILAAGIAHDFNNILSAVYGNIELAYYKLPADLNDIKEYLNMALSSMDRARRLSKQLLTFAKGGLPVFEAVNLENLIRSTIDFALSGSNVKVHYNIEDNLPSVKADEGQISEAITNIVVNAKQAMPDGGNIYITARKVDQPIIFNFNKVKGQFVEISIKDEGCGIPADHINNIFDPYFTTKECGTGLGLSIVHSIVKKHHGYIVVESIPNESTEFKIYLPISDEKEKKEMENPEVNNGEAKKILVIDDEPDIRQVLKSMLEILGHETYTSPDPVKGIELFKRELNSNKFDVVILDLTMPGYPEGDKLLKQFKDLDKNVKVIACSGYSNSPIITNYKKYGFDERITKPFSLNDVKRKINCLF